VASGMDVGVDKSRILKKQDYMTSAIIAYMDN